MKLNAIMFLSLSVLLSACTVHPQNSDATFVVIPYPPTFMFKTGPGPATS